MVGRFLEELSRSTHLLAFQQLEGFHTYDILAKAMAYGCSIYTVKNVR